MAWFENLKVDLARACGYETGSPLRRLLLALCAPGTQAVVVYRFGRYSLGHPLLSLAYYPLYFLVRVLWGIEVPRTAEIGPGLYIGHFGGITVSGKARIGRDCSLSQGITIGRGGSGTRCGVPVIGEGVYIAPGARIFGAIRIGDNVRIGANAVVYRDIPDDAVVALDPGFKIISYRGNRRSANVTPLRSDTSRNASTA
jgi:serine O-acetyltransferase